MNDLQLPLIKKWFEMSKAGIKKEDYREINEYWFKRFVKNYEDVFSHFNEGKTLKFFDKQKKEELIKNILQDPVKVFTITFNKYKFNKMTLGYPKRDDSERILFFEHKGIEVRTGKPEWGAEEGKLYFCIIHGERCTKDIKVIDPEEVKSN